MIEKSYISTIFHPCNYKDYVLIGDILRTGLLDGGQPFGASERFHGLTDSIRLGFRHEFLDCKHPFGDIMSKVADNSLLIQIAFLRNLLYAVSLLVKLESSDFGILLLFLDRLLLRCPAGLLRRLELLWDKIRCFIDSFLPLSQIIICREVLFLMTFSSKSRSFQIFPYLLISSLFSALISAVFSRKSP